MSVYKSFNQDQIHYRTTTVNKTFNENQDSDGVYTIHLISGSTNEDSSSYYNTINTLFYYNNGRSGAHLSQGNIYSYSSYYKNPQYKNKWNDEAVLISISSSKFGDSIKPGSFIFTDSSTSDIITIKDDSYGNLYATNAGNYNDITSGTPSSSISSSENYVGNIFYETGIAVLTETGSYVNNYWDLDNTGFETSGPSMSDEGNLPHGIFFKPDGTRYFMISSQGNNEGVFEYEMSTAWDVSTAVYTENSLSLAPHFNSANDAHRSISFKPDGTKLFITNEDNETIKAWDLDIGWDLSSFDESDYASLEKYDLDGAASIVENKPKGHYFREDGLKLYIVGEQKNSAIEYNLSTAWDLTSIGGFSQSYDIGASVSPAETEINGIFFKPDGTRMYTGGNDNNVVYEHRLSTAWDVSTATFQTSESISSKETQIHDVHWKPDGSKMYIVGHGSDKVHQYQHSASFYTSSGDSFDIQFDSTITIPTMEYNCRVEPGEFNSTLNPTILSSSAAVTSSMNIKAEYYNKMGKQNYSPLPYQLNLTSLDRRFISDKFKNDKFRTYITKIGLYNDKNQLIMVASLPVPVQVSKKQPLNIKVRMDY